MPFKYVVRVSGDWHPFTETLNNDNMTPGQQAYYQSKQRSIVAVNTDGSMAGCFDSIKVAHEKYGLTRHLLTKACKTGNLYRGIKWMFEDEYRHLWEQGKTDMLKYERPEWQKPLQRGDRVNTGTSLSSLRTYARALIKAFGTDITLGEISKLIDIERIKDNTKDNVTLTL